MREGSHMFFDPVEISDLDFDTIFHQYEEPCELKAGLKRHIVAYEGKDGGIRVAVGFGAKDQDIFSLVWFLCQLTDGEQDEDLSDYRDFYQSCGEICQEQHIERLRARFTAGREGFI